MKEIDNLEINRYKKIIKDQRDTINLFLKSDSAANQLRARDTEQHIKAVKWFSENYCDDEHSFLADKAIEQLSKGVL